MNCPAPPWVTLWSTADSFTHLGKRFQPQHSDWQLGHALLFVLLTGMAVFGAWLASRYVRHRSGESNSPRALFDQLCRAHRLDWAARRLLSQLARWRGLSTPASLFVEPEHFDTATLDEALRARREELRSLRDKIFGAAWCQTHLRSQ
jgi:hypothetical protein